MCCESVGEGGGGGEELGCGTRVDDGVDGDGDAGE